MQIATTPSLLSPTQPPLPPELKPAPPSHADRSQALDKAAEASQPNGAQALPLAPQDASVHDELLRFPEHREELYRQLTRTDPGLINHLEQARPSDLTLGTNDSGADTLRRLALAGPPAFDGIRSDLRPTLSADAAERAAAAPAPAPAPAAPADQARTDAAQLQATYNDTLQRTGSEAQAAQAASAQLDALSAGHAGDSVYTNTLLREALPTLNRIGQVLGRHVNGEFNGGGADKQRIVDTVQNLARAAGRGGDFGAELVAGALAPHIPDKSELHKLDDAFYGHLAHGGDTRLFQALAGRLQALGKGQAADELLNQHEGLVGRIVGGVKDALGAAGGFVKSVSGDVLTIVRDGAELAVDVAQGTVDIVGDGVDAAQAAVDFAAENGLKLVGKALDFAVDLYRKALDKGLGLSKNIDKLGPGDRYDLSIDVEVALRVGVQAGGGVSITRTEDGYEVSGHFGAQVDLKFGAGLSGGGAGEVTFSAKTPEEARQLALILAGGPKPSEAGFVRQHLKSLELDASGAAQLELVNAGIGNIKDTLAGGAQLDIGLKLEFEGGSPKNMVIVGRLSGEAEAASDKRLDDPKLAALRQLAGQLGMELPDSFDANAQLALTVETRIPLGDALNAGLDAVLHRPSQALLDAARHASTTLTLDASVELGTDGRDPKGRTFHAEISGLDAADAKALVRGLAQGDLSQAWDQVSFKADVWSADYTRHDGSPLDLNVVAKGWGGSINTEASKTDVDWDHRQHVAVNKA